MPAARPLTRQRARNLLHCRRRTRMPSSPTLTSTLEEHTGLAVEGLARPGSAATIEELEPLPALLPPEGVTQGGPGRGRSRRGPQGGRGCRLPGARGPGRRRRGHGRGRGPRLRGARVIPLRRRQSRSPRRDEPHGDAVPPRSRAPVVSALRSGERALAQGRAARPAPPSRRSHRGRARARPRRAGALALRVGVPPGAGGRGPRHLRGARRAARRLAAVERAAGARRAVRRARDVDEAVRPRGADHPEGRGRAAAGVAAPGSRGHPRRADLGARARPDHPAGREHGLADQQDAGAGRRRRARPRLLRLRRLPARVLRRARAAARLRRDDGGRRNQ